MANQVAYGFTTLKDMFAERVAVAGVDVVNTAIQQSVDEHNRQIAALMSLFVTPVTNPQMRYKTPTALRLQPLDESGRARPIRVAGHYDVAFPLQAGGVAWGGTDVTIAKMTVEEANRYTLALLSADARWVRDHILAALFANASWTYTDDDDDVGSLTIKGPANGDTDVYLLLSGADSGATDTHFLAQAAAIADATNPYPTIYSELKEHPENGGEVLALVASNQVATTKALSEYHPAADPNLRPGMASDVLVGSLGVQHPGELFGYTDSKVWLSEWRSMPDNYIVAVTTEGDAPLGMREDPEPELRGFKKVAERNDHPFVESQWRRRAGFGARNRVGVVVQRIGNAAYAVPTNYSSPMA